MGELNFLPAVVMAELVRHKKLSPVELLEAHLAQIQRLNPELKAFVQVDAERARRDACTAEAAVAREDGLGPLHGVPVSIKSSIDVAGLRCEAGTRLRAGHVAAQDAPLVARLRAAGAVVLGVTNTPELLMAWETDNLLYGRSNNPGIFHARPAVPVAVKRRRSPPVARRAEWAATAAAPSECRRISAESAGSSQPLAGFRQPGTFPTRSGHSLCSELLDRWREQLLT